jgi:predicted Ser/Thr protein kinase
LSIDYESAALNERNTQQQVFVLFRFGLREKERKKERKVTRRKKKKKKKKERKPSKNSGCM